MCGLDGAGASFDYRHRAGRMPVSPLAGLSFVGQRVWGISGLPMGQSAPGDRVSHDLLCALAVVTPDAMGPGLRTGPAFRDRPLAAALALVQADVRVRLREAAQWRPDLEG